jgi:hypothetical protein
LASSDFSVNTSYLDFSFAPVVTPRFLFGEFALGFSQLFLIFSSVTWIAGLFTI